METCQHPEKLKGKPGECTPEQMKECHGEEEGYSLDNGCPCEAEINRNGENQK